MPLRDYLCDYCGHEFTELVMSKDPEHYQTYECRCGSKAKLLPSMIGGYQGNMGSSSSRPKHSTAMPSKKVYTGKPGQVDEPQVEEKKNSEDNLAKNSYGIWVGKEYD